MGRCGVAPDFGEPDAELHRQGFSRVCGLDEVGCGPLAGPVVAGAVILPCDARLAGLNDSKRLSPADRERLAPAIREAALAWGVGVATPAEVDAMNVLRASLLAMMRAVQGLGVAPDYLLVDGRNRVDLPVPQQTLDGGDGRSSAIAAASVLAKQHRDALMTEYARVFPGYGFEDHKGYPTPAHRRALDALGPSPIHRISFRGVRELVSPSPQLPLFPQL